MTPTATLASHCEAPIAQTPGTHGMRAVLCRQSRYIRSWHDSAGTVHRACPKHLAQRTALYAPADAPWPGDLPVDEGEPAAVRPAARSPRPGDPIIVYGDRLTVLALRDRGQGPLIVTDDDAGFRIERPADRLVWSAEDGAWRG